MSIKEAFCSLPKERQWKIKLALFLEVGFIAGLYLVCSVLGIDASSHVLPGGLVLPIANFTLYAVVAYIIYQWKVLPALENRHINIDRSIRDAQQELLTVQDNLQAANERLAEIENEKQQIISEIVAQGESIKTSISESLPLEIEKIKDDAQKQIGNFSDQARAKLHRSVVEAASMLSREKIGEQLSADKDREIRREAVNSIFN